MQSTSSADFDRVHFLALATLHPSSHRFGIFSYSKCTWHVALAIVEHLDGLGSTWQGPIGLALFFVNYDVRIKYLFKKYPFSNFIIHYIK